MSMMILGLVLFLGVHSIGMVAGPWRDRMRERLGRELWKGMYSLIALAGLALVAWGFDLARERPVLLWMPPVFLRHGAALLILAAFILLAAAYIQGNQFKAWLGHPMVVGVKVWALAHLLVSGLLAQVVLFGSFLVWSVAMYSVARRRDRAQGLSYPVGRPAATGITVALGVAAWAVFAFGLHGVLIGVKPLG